MLLGSGGQSLSGGTYWARIDQDCGPTLVPTAIQQPAGTVGGVAVSCPTAADTNETAVVTAWATVGSGRARSRGILSIDNPWKHVCSNSSQDNPPGYCNEPANRNGNPTVTPADPNDPNGPAAYDDLPRPQLGCSAIDVTLHGETALNCPPGTNYNYPYPVGKRLVVTGDATLANCNGGGQSYSGYFDCALSTPCPAAICGGSGRAACVNPGDTRINGTTYVSSLGGCGTNTGMVFTGSINWPANYGSAGAGVNIYVMRPGTFTIQSRDLHGVVVVEGDGAANCTGNRDVQHRNGARIWTETNVYGYPLAYLVYDPQLPAPTANPLAPQNTCADMGSAAGTEIHGILYSGGNVELNPIVMDGTVLAFQIQTQASSSVYGYNATYGNAAPPPGFPVGSGNQVVLIRKSFIVCSSYADDSGGGSACP
jgi:hypothetical protein